MYSLQTSIEIGQASFKIRNKGDFRMVLDCFEVMNDDELSMQEKLFVSLIIFYEDFNSFDDISNHMDILEELQKSMMNFINNGDENTKSNTQDRKVLDWKKDSNLICSAINNIAKTEIRALDYLHWWTFLGYYTAIGECLLSTVVSIRYKLAKGEKLEKYEKKFKQNNPEYFNIDMRSAEEKAADEYFRKLWGEQNG